VTGGSAVVIGPRVGFLVGIGDGEATVPGPTLETRGRLPPYREVESLAAAHGLAAPSLIVSAAGVPRVTVDGRSGPDPAALRSAVGMVLRAGGALAGPVPSETVPPALLAAELSRQDPDVVLLTGSRQGPRRQALLGFAKDAAASGKGDLTVIEQEDGEAALMEAVRRYLGRSLAAAGYSGVSFASYGAAAAEAARRLQAQVCPEEVACSPGRVGRPDVALVLAEADGAVIFVARRDGVDAASFSLAGTDSLDLLRGPGGRASRPGAPTGLPSFESLAARLPWVTEPAEVADMLANTLTEPWGRPASAAEAAVARALLQEVLQRLVSGWSLAVGPESGGNPSAARLLVGSGFGLARLGDPRRAAVCLVEGLGPTGVTIVAVDTTGSLLVEAVARGGGCRPPETVAVSVAPVRTAGRLRTADSRPLAVVTVEPPAGPPVVRLLVAGQVSAAPVPLGEWAGLKIEPCSRDVDFGCGPGRTWRGRVPGGAVGLVLDGRPRPLQPPSDPVLAAVRNRALLAACGLPVDDGARRPADRAAGRGGTSRPVPAAGQIEVERSLPPGSLVRVRPGETVGPDTVIGTVRGGRRVLALPAAGNVELLKKPGQPVKEGETVAVRRELLGLALREFVSPCGGLVESVNPQRTALVVTEGDREVRALLGGVVVSAGRGEVRLQVMGRRIPGRFGFGEAVAGPLERMGQLLTEADARRRLGPEVAGRILLFDSFLAPQALPLLGRYGVAGVVCGGVDFADLWALIFPGGPFPAGRGLPTFLATEPFGTYPMDEGTARVLIAAAGRTVYVSGGSGGSEAKPAFAPPCGPEIVVPAE